MLTKSQIRAIAKRAGLTIESRTLFRMPEVLVSCKIGHCWAYDCHERVFSCETVAEAWRAVAEEIQWLADHQEPCGPVTCCGWVDGKCDWHDDA